MAELTTAKRDKLPDSVFAGPARSYPVQDKSHARNALGRAKQQENKGNLSAEEYGKIVAKADKVLKDGKLKKKTPPKDPPASAAEPAPPAAMATGGPPGADMDLDDQMGMVQQADPDAM